MEATAFWVTELYDEWTIDFYHYECCGQLLFIANRNTPGMSTRASNGGDAEICPIERDVTLWGDTMKLMTLFCLADRSDLAGCEPQCSRPLVRIKNCMFHT